MACATSIRLIIGSEITLGNSTYRLSREIGRGANGVVYLVKNTESNEEVAMKVGRTSSKILNEYIAYKALEGGVGVPRVTWSGEVVIQEKKYKVMVMELLGANLEFLFLNCRRRFSLKTVLMLADQMITRLEYVHNHNYVHRDIKSGNFVIGRGNQRNNIFLVDFGASNTYRDAKTNEHIKFSTGKPMCSTPRCSSINAHLGFEQSRRDDLESVGYLLLYFIKGVLPWQHLKAPAELVRNVICEKKTSIPLEKLCEDLPDAFVQYLKYCRALEFESTPDYDYLRQLFRTVMSERGMSNDSKFDWDLPATSQKRKTTGTADSKASQ